MFLTRVGHMSDDKRQEFILLSDTLGISMLVDAINHRQPEGATETTVLGPFYVQDPPVLEHEASIFGRAEGGTPLHVIGTSPRRTATPLAGAFVDVWQSDDDGFYDVQKAGRRSAAARAVHRRCRRHGSRFWTLVPNFYPIPDDGPVGDMLKATKRHPYRPAHIHFMIGA